MGISSEALPVHAQRYSRAAGNAVPACRAQRSSWGSDPPRSLSLAACADAWPGALPPRCGTHSPARAGNNPLSSDAT